MNARFDFRLAIPVGFAWGVLAVIEFLGAPALPTLIVCATGSALALTLAFTLRRKSGIPILALIAVAFAFASLLILRTMQEPAIAQEDPGRCAAHVRLDSGNPLPAAATVVQADCESGQREGGSGSLSGPALLLEAIDEEAAIEPGMLGFGTIIAADCDTWLFEGTWMLDCTGAEVLERPIYARLSASWRASFQLANEPLPGDGGALLAGLAIGDTSRVDDSLQDAMLDAGLSHLTAVSGANCAIVTGAAFGVCATLGARRWMRVLVALVALGAFVILVTPEPSVVRASLMAIIALAGFIRGQPRGAVPLLALAVLVGLLVNPTLATSIGFVLSVLATAGLIVHANPIAEKLTAIMPKPLAFAIAVPAAAQLWCLPVLILLDNGVQPLSVLWNLAAAPAAPVVTVIGLIACIASQAVPVVGTLIAWLAWPAAAWIAALARLSETLGPWHIPWAEGLTGALLAAAAIVAVALLLKGKRAGLAMLVVTAIIAMSLVTVPQALRRASLGGWRIMQCGVEQGHATLVRVGEATILIDTGEHEDLLQDCLDLAGVSSLSAVFLTHFDRDHSGATGVIRGRVSSVFHGPSTEEDAGMLDALENSGAEVQEIGEGTNVTIGRLVIDVLWPRPGAEPGNAASLVLILREAESPGPFLVILGDLGEAEQRALAGTVPPAPVLLAAHHCSADQHAALYAEVQPEVVLVGVGENTYGHPTQECLSVIADAGAHPLRTDEHGSIAIMRDGSVWLGGVD